VRDALGDVQSVLVFGGGSDIALATVRRLVGRRARTVVLAAHHPDALDGARDELPAAGATTVQLVGFHAAARALARAICDGVILATTTSRFLAAFASP